MSEPPSWPSLWFVVSLLLFSSNGACQRSRIQEAGQKRKGSGEGQPPGDTQTYRLSPYRQKQLCQERDFENREVESLNPPNVGRFSRAHRYPSTLPNLKWSRRNSIAPLDCSS